MGRYSVAVVCLAIASSLVCLACEQTRSEVLAALDGAWETSTPSGDVERVLFDVQTITYGHGTDRAFTCPYRVNAFHEKESLIELRIKCEQRTGADAWIDYSLEFGPDRQAFTLKLGERGLGTFRRAS